MLNKKRFNIGIIDAKLISLTLLCNESICQKSLKKEFLSTFLIYDMCLFITTAPKDCTLPIDHLLCVVQPLMSSYGKGLVFIAAAKMGNLEPSRSLIVLIG